MDVTEVQDLLERAVAAWSVPGAAVGLLRGEERHVLTTGTLGVEDDRPVTAGTAFHAGLITKSLVGLVVLHAARQGQVDLDVPCDEQGGPGLWSDTPRALLAQTTGRPNLLPEADDTLEGFVARTASLPRVHPPGRFSYCNAGWPVLDLLLQRRTGRSFEQLAEDLLGPLTFGVPAHAAHGHRASPGRPLVRVDHDDWPVSSAPGARWFATADELLDHATLHLRGRDDLHPDDLVALRATVAPMPGGTVMDGWGLGWAVWDRGPHRAFGWAGFTSGHRTYLRCFPDHDAALVVLAGSAGPILGPPGGSALADVLVPALVEALGVPSLPDPSHAEAHPAEALAGSYGPLTVRAGQDDGIELDAQAFGAPEPISCRRLGGDTFATGEPGGMPLAFDDGLLYVGPFALPRG